MTKEPKLQAAMRIVPEWKTYDYEIKTLWDQIYNTSTKTQTEYSTEELDKQGKHILDRFNMQTGKHILQTG